MQFNDLPPECIAVGICPYLNSRVKMSGPLQRIKSSHDLTIEPLSASTGVSAIGKRNRAFDGPELAGKGIQILIPCFIGASQPFEAAIRADLAAPAQVDSKTRPPAR